VHVLSRGQQSANILKRFLPSAAPYLHKNPDNRGPVTGILRGDASMQRTSKYLLFVLCVVVGSLPGCRREVKQPPLPTKIPVPPAIQFTKVEEGWPPRPQGRTNESYVPWTQRPGAFTESQEAGLRQAALQDAQVRTVLGDRFAYITASEVEPDKARPRNATEPVPVDLTFYSYSNNVAVEVRMTGQKVEKVYRREGYQPPEGAEEVKAAIALALQNEQAPQAVHNMRATAILTYYEPGTPEHGHRILHVSFSSLPDYVPQYFALVDLTANKVLAFSRIGENGGVR
jgi:hypothetical protein